MENGATVPGQASASQQPSSKSLMAKAAVHPPSWGPPLREVPGGAGGPRTTQPGDMVPSGGVSALASVMQCPKITSLGPRDALGTETEQSQGSDAFITILILHSSQGSQEILSPLPEKPTQTRAFIVISERHTCMGTCSWRQHPEQEPGRSGREAAVCKPVPGELIGKRKGKRVTEKSPFHNPFLTLVTYHPDCPKRLSHSFPQLLGVLGADGSQLSSSL